MNSILAKPIADTATERALLDEQFRTLSQQIPVLYALMCANALFLAFATSGTAAPALTFTFPAILCLAALVRMLVWYRRRRRAVPNPAKIRKHLRSTIYLAAALSSAFGGWALLLFEQADLAQQTCIALYIFIGLVSSSYCLQCLPAAGHAVLLFGTLPIAVRLVASGEIFLLGLACNFLLVSILILRMLRNNHTRLTEAVSSKSEIMLERERALEAERTAHQLAYHDPLTGLPNRLLLQQRLEQAVASASGTGGHVGLLILDVDNFKLINDTLGHDAGDALLCTFATRLETALRPDDLVARLGGDEFAVVLMGVASEQELHAAVTCIQKSLRDPWVHGGRLLDCEASIGGSIYPQQGSCRVELMKNADIALYSAKSEARGNLKIFRPTMRADAQKHASMIRVAKNALQSDLIVPYYQPKMKLGSEELDGFEALLRWRDPSRGIQAPATIGAAFEDPTTAAAISDRMVACVISDMRRWLDQGVPFGHVAINAAAAEFRQGAFAEQLLERLHQASIAPSYIQLEVTETVFLGRGAKHVEQALQTLSRHGVAIALDDFGTGFASLSHLKQFPVDILKIDRSFVRDLLLDPDDRAIVDAVIGLGRSLDIGVVAEGIETSAQRDFLCARGCDYGQGYFYGKAIPASRIANLVRRLGCSRPTEPRPPAALLPLSHAA